MHCVSHMFLFTSSLWFCLMHNWILLTYIGYHQKDLVWQFMYAIFVLGLQNHNFPNSTWHCSDSTNSILSYGQWYFSIYHTMITLLIVKEIVHYNLSCSVSLVLLPILVLFTTTFVIFFLVFLCLTFSISLGTIPVILCA